MRSVSAILVVVGLVWWFIGERKAARLASWDGFTGSLYVLPGVAVTCLGILGLLASVHWALAGVVILAVLYGLYRLVGPDEPV